MQPGAARFGHRLAWATFTFITGRHRADATGPRRHWGAWSERAPPRPPSRRNATSTAAQRRMSARRALRDRCPRCNNISRPIKRRLASSPRGCRTRRYSSEGRDPRPRSWSPSDGSVTQGRPPGPSQRRRPRLPEAPWQLPTGSGRRNFSPPALFRSSLQAQAAPPSLVALTGRCSAHRTLPRMATPPAAFGQLLRW